MPEPKIILVNRALARNCVGKLSGWSGVEYEHSHFEDEHQGHVIRLTLERWREIKQDVTHGFCRRFCQWEVDIEEPVKQSVLPPRRNTEESLAAVTNFRTLLSLAKKEGVENLDEIDTAEGLRKAIFDRESLRREEAWADSIATGRKPIAV